MAFETAYLFPFHVWLTLPLWMVFDQILSAENLKCPIRNLEANQNESSDFYQEIARLYPRLLHVIREHF